MAENKFNLVELSTPLLMGVMATWFFAFTRQDVSSAYQFVDVASPYLWGSLFCVIGLLKGYSIVFDNYILRQTTELVSVVLWITMAGVFFWGNYRSHLAPLCLFFTYQSFSSWQRITPHNRNE